MTLADLRQAALLLPEGASLTLPRDAVLAATQEGAPVALHATPEPDRWLTADQVAERYHVTKRWTYDHADALGARRLSRRCVRFSERGIERYMARQGRAS